MGKNNWKPGDIGYLAGCTRVEIIGELYNNHLKVRITKPTPHSRYNKGDEIAMIRTFIHKRQHRK